MSLNMTDANSTVEPVSPVTLSAEWSRVARLLLMVSLAAVGSIGNVFMISAVMIEDYLRRRGKFIYLASCCLLYLNKLYLQNACFL